MFLMIGLGERAGSGLTKIQRGWRESGKRLNLADSFEPYDQTRLDMAYSREGPDSARRFGKMSGKTSGKMSGKTSGKVLHLLEEAPELSIPEIAMRLGKSERTIERATRELRSIGKLTRIGPD
jgi:predicted HTH transcriptional regulator